MVHVLVKLGGISQLPFCKKTLTKRRKLNSLSRQGRKEGQVAAKKVVAIIPALMPIGPAIVLALTIHRLFIQIELNQIMAWVLAVVLALIFEATGYYLAHGLMTQVEAQNTYRIIVNLVFLLGFVVGAIGIIVWGYADIESDLVAAILAVFPVFASMVYVTQAMRLNVDSNRQRVDARERAEWEFTFELERRKAEQQLEFERQKAEQELEIQRQAEATKERIKADRAAAQIESKYKSKDRPVVIQGITQNPTNTGNVENLAAINERKRRSVEENLGVVLDYLKQNPDANYSQIGNHIGQTKSSGENYARRLVEAGSVVQNGHGNGPRWRVVGDSEEA
jgi:hypothetical protein